MSTFVIILAVIGALFVGTCVMGSLALLAMIVWFDKDEDFARRNTPTPGVFADPLPPQTPSERRPDAPHIPS